jgi:hypothetical protein
MVTAFVRRRLGVAVNRKRVLRVMRLVRSQPRPLPNQAVFGCFRPVNTYPAFLVGADGVVPVVSRAPTAFGRSPEQRLRALAKANEVRVARARG